jgi:hypothetical protein
MLPNIEQALRRAGLQVGPTLLDTIDQGAGRLRLGTDAVIEVSPCVLHHDPEGRTSETDGGLLLLFRFDVGVWNRAVEDLLWLEVKAIARATATTDASGWPSIQLISHHDESVVLSWPNAHAERDRVLTALRAVQARDFSAWDGAAAGA